MTKNKQYHLTFKNKDQMHASVELLRTASRFSISAFQVSSYGWSNGHNHITSSIYMRVY